MSHSSKSHNSRPLPSRRRRRTSPPGTTSGLHLVQTVSDKRVAVLIRSHRYSLTTRWRARKSTRESAWWIKATCSRCTRTKQARFLPSRSPNNGEPAPSSPRAESSYSDFCRELSRRKKGTRTERLSARPRGNSNTYICAELPRRILVGVATLPSCRRHIYPLRWHDFDNWTFIRDHVVARDLRGCNIDLANSF